MKTSLNYNSLILAVATSLALSLSACGGGSSSSGDTGVPKTKKEKPSNPTKKDIDKKVAPVVPPKTPSTSSGEKGCGSFSKTEMLQKVNELRSQSRMCYQTNKRFNATHAVKWNKTLEKSTKKFAYDMANNSYYNYFGGDAHLQPDTSKPKPWKIKDAITFNKRSQQFGYLVPSKVGGLVRENLAWSQNGKKPDIKTAVKTAYYGDGVTSKGWLKSTHGHCETIMNPIVEDFAMSCAYNAKTNKYYFVQMFGVRCTTVEECQKKGIPVKNN